MPRVQLTSYDMSNLTRNLGEALDAVRSVLHYQQTQAVGNTSHSPEVAVETILQLQRWSDSIARIGYSAINRVNTDD